MPLKRPSIADLLLGWYGANARVLPWRARTGVAPDPYRVWLSEVMLQQTTVTAVRPRFATWVARWPDVASLAAADEGEVMAAWAGLGYYARARNLVKAARAVVGEHGGRFPDTEEALRALPGLGIYTAAAVAAIAFGQRAVVVDANVERVVARLSAIVVPLPGGRAAIRAAAAAVTPDACAGDFAQGMMDLGSAICTPRRPRCLLCPLRERCAGFATGAPERFPVKPAKAERPLRHGTVFWLERDGRVLLVRRPPEGLLGGMRAFPTGPWEDAPPGIAGSPVVADWRMLAGTVEHGFTHFRLSLALAVATVPAQTILNGDWWPVDDIGAAGLPTVFARAGFAVREETG